MEAGEIELITRRLAKGYGWKHIDLCRVGAGQSTTNFSGSADGQPIFVKVYPPHTNMNAELLAISLCEFAGAAGVPTARILRTVESSTVLAGGDMSLSVWRLVEGVSADRIQLDPARMAIAGTVTGQLHRALASHPAVPVHREYGELCDLDRAAQKINHVLDTLTSQTGSDSFTDWAIDVLRWRLALLPRIAALQAELPPLASQVVHGDLASPNILFDEGRLTAVLDFRPPHPRRIAWEISRLACDPRTIVCREDWRSGFMNFLRAYRAAAPEVPITDLAASVRVWACYTAASIYPYDVLADGDAAFPDLLRDYAQDRQAALVTVLAELDDIELDIRGTVARASQP